MSIVKVKRKFGHKWTHPVTIGTQGGLDTIEQVIDHDTQKLMGPRLIAYFNAVWDAKTKRWDLGTLAADQYW